MKLLLHTTDDGEDVTLHDIWIDARLTGECEYCVDEMKSLLRSGEIYLVTDTRKYRIRHKAQRRGNENPS